MEILAALGLILFAAFLVLSFLLLRSMRHIMTSQAQLAQDLIQVKEAVAKVGTETSTLVQKVADLEAAISNGGNTTPEVDAALQALKDQVQVVDDLVADVPAPQQ